MIAIPSYLIAIGSFLISRCLGRGASKLRPGYCEVLNAFALLILLGQPLDAFQSSDGRDSGDQDSIPQTLNPQEATGQDPIRGNAEDPSRSPVKLVGVATPSYSTIRPGSVLTVRATLDSQSSKSENVRLVITIPSQPSIESVYEVELNPVERRVVQCAVNIPSNLVGLTAIELVFTLRQWDGSREVLLQDGKEPIENRLRIPIAENRVITVTNLDRTPRMSFDWEWPKRDLHQSYELMVATRIAAGQSRSVMQMESEAIPEKFSQWDAIDNLVISNKEMFQDAGGIDAMRQWVMRGGRLWIMLDLVPAELIRPLLMPGQSVTVIDRTELTELELESDWLDSQGVPSSKLNLDASIQMQRVVQSGGEVTHRINGYPAAIWMPIGYGEILLTTASSMAWMEKRTGPVPREETLRSAFQLRSWVGPLADRFHVSRDRILPRKPLLPYPAERIGIKVLSRWSVFLALAVYCLLLGIASGLLWWKQRVEWIGWVAPILALLIGTSVAFAAGALRGDVGPTWSRLQWVQVHSTQGDVTVAEQSAIYLPSPVQRELTSTTDFIAEPILGEEGSRAFRTSTQENSAVRLKSDNWPSGVWSSDLEYSLPTQVGPAIGRLDQDGLTVEYPSSLPSPMSDTLVVMPKGAIASLVSLDERSGRSSPEATLPPGIWRRSGMVTDEQRRQDPVLKALTTLRSGKPSPNSLSVIGWTELWPNQFQWDQPFAEVGSAVVTLPLVIERPKPGELIAVPPCLVALETVESQFGKTGAFINSTGQWGGPFNNPILTQLRFKLPVELLPLKVQEIKILTRVRAPGRKVRVLAVNDGATDELGEWMSPQGVIEISIATPVQMEAASRGQLQFQLDVGVVESEAGSSAIMQTADWSVEYFWISLKGLVEPTEQ